MERYDYKRCIDGIWDLYFAENEQCEVYADEINSVSDLKSKKLNCITAKVPGNFELDFMENGLLPDVFYGTNVLKLQEMEYLHFWYVKKFESDIYGEDLSFIFEGIDTISDIYLNGHHIGETDNMFINHKVSSKGLINKGINELIVHIKPCVIESRKENFGMEVNTHQFYNAASLKIRKAAHSFGWDIMPRAISAGLWKSVYLVREKQDYIDELYLYPGTFLENQVRLCGYYRTELSHDNIKKYCLKIKGKCGDRVFEWKNNLWHNQSSFCIFVDEPLLWWPRDMGKQNLYDVEAELFYEDKCVDTFTTRLGIRDVKLEISESTDEEVGKFKFWVNGEPLFVRGTNWVPMDVFHSRDSERLPKALDLLLESKCNMVRCWGGNVYEEHEFFDFCDEKGILVWQDFCMGCAAYPQDEEFCNKLKIEAETIVKKLRQHPSLAVWAGDNECDEATAYWGVTSFDPNNNLLTRKVLPEVLKRTDPKRPFLPSSPYISSNSYKYNLPLPEKHIWGPRDYCKSDFYAKSSARFASETGWHGCNSVESIKKFISPEKLWSWQNNDEWRVHASSMETSDGAPYVYRIDIMEKQIKEVFGFSPDNLEQYSLASQIVQAEAVKFLIEHFRNAKWERTGIIWWNLIDGWPQFSDAVIDYYYNKKIAFEFIKRSQEPVCLMMREPENGGMVLVGCNEFLSDKTISYKITDLTDKSFVCEGKTVLSANSSKEIVQIPFDVQNVHFYIIKWECDGEIYKNHYISGNVPYDFKKTVDWLKKAELI